MNCLGLNIDGSGRMRDSEGTGLQGCCRKAGLPGWTGEPRIIYRANLNRIVKVFDFVKSGGPSGIRTQSLR